MTSAKTPMSGRAAVVAAMVNAFVNVVRIVFTTVPAAPLSGIRGTESLAGRGPVRQGYRGVTRRPTLVHGRGALGGERRFCNQPAGRGVHFP